MDLKITGYVDWTDLILDEIEKPALVTSGFQNVEVS
jgi:hypothetical protein